MTNLLNSIQNLFKKPADIIKPVDFWGHKKAYLHYLLRSHFWRWARFTVISTACTGIGFLILYLAVAHWGLGPVLGYLIENAIVLQIAFILNRYITFGDRSANWFRALFKWHVSRLSMFGAGQLFFFLLVSLAGMHYMTASIVIALSLGFFDYILSDIFAFSSKLQPAFVHSKA